MQMGGVLLVAIALTAPFSQGKGMVRLYKLDCIPEAAWIANASCNIKKLAGDRTAVNLAGDLVKEVRNISIHMQLHRFKGRFRPFLVDVWGNACDLLAGKAPRQSFITVLTALIKANSNINHTCPFHERLFTKDIVLQDNLMQFALPAGRFRLDFDVYEGYPMALMGRVQYYAEVVAGGFIAGLKGK